MMVKVLLYAYCIGVPSSRKVERRLEEDVAFRVLAANNTPDFRKEPLAALASLFLQARLCPTPRLPSGTALTPTPTSCPPLAASPPQADSRPTPPSWQWTARWWSGCEEPALSETKGS